MKYTFFLDLSVSKAKYGELLILLQITELLRALGHETAIYLVVNFSKDNKRLATTLKHIGGDSVMKKCSLQCDELLSKSIICSNYIFVIPHARFYKLLTSQLDYSSLGEVIYIDDYISRKCVLAKQHALLSSLIEAVARLEGSFNSYLVGENLLSNTKTSNNYPFPYATSVYRYNDLIYRDAKNTNEDFLIKMAELVYSKLGLHTLVFTSREGAERMRNKIKNISFIALANCPGDFIGQLYCIGDSRFHYQIGGGGMSIPFMLSQSYNYCIMQNTGPYFPVNIQDKKIFPFSTEFQHWKVTTSFSQAYKFLNKYLEKFEV